MFTLTPESRNRTVALMILRQIFGGSPRFPSFPHSQLQPCPLTTCYETQPLTVGGAGETRVLMSQDSLSEMLLKLKRKKPY